MAGRGAKWLWGCGIGCAALLVLVIGVVVAGSVLLRNAVKRFDAVAESTRALDERFGVRASYTPPPSGGVPAERMEAFLTVREATDPARRRVARAFAGLPLSESQARELGSQRFVAKLRSLFGVVGSAVDLGRSFGELFEARNRALLAGDMGMGEYVYIYVLSYGVWLGHSFEDGPVQGKIEAEAEEPSRRSAHQDWNREELARLREDLRAMLSNQLASLPPDAAPESGDGEWRRTLSAEIEAMERDPSRWPWQDGLPAAVVASFEPFRARLEATYDPATNAFEMMHSEKTAHFTFERK